PKADPGEAFLKLPVTHFSKRGPDVANRQNPEGSWSGSSCVPDQPDDGTRGAPSLLTQPRGAEPQRGERAHRADRPGIVGREGEAAPRSPFDGSRRTEAPAEAAPPRVVRCGGSFGGQTTGAGRAAAAYPLHPVVRQTRAEADLRRCRRLHELPRQRP